MIDPNNIINYKRTTAQKEELLMFLICVAGKTAKTVSVQLDKFLGKNSKAPFAYLKKLKDSGKLKEELHNAKFGQYTKIEKSFKQLAEGKINLDTCSLENLMEIHGVGRKSASCFLCWTRPKAQYAMLDTHILKWIATRKVSLNYNSKGLPPRHELRDLYSLIEDVKIPKTTPSSKRLYDTLEKFYLDYCGCMGFDPTELDLVIWKQYAKA